MNKKNSGFSLVELIVVIAIMAVLVGVLAPAYLKYVEKSRKSADLDALDSAVKAVDAVVSDDEYSDDMANVKYFILESTSAAKQTCTLKVVDSTGNSVANALKAWTDTANVKTINFKSKAAKAAAIKLQGEYDSAKGSVTWSVPTKGQLLDSSKVSEAKNFLNKLNLS